MHFGPPYLASKGTNLPLFTHCNSHLQKLTIICQCITTAAVFTNFRLNKQNTMLSMQVEWQICLSITFSSCLINFLFLLQYKECIIYIYIKKKCLAKICNSPTKNALDKKKVLIQLTLPKSYIKCINQNYCISSQYLCKKDLDYTFKTRHVPISSKCPGADP